MDGVILGSRDIVQLNNLCERHFRRRCHHSLEYVLFAPVQNGVRVDETHINIGAFIVIYACFACNAFKVQKYNNARVVTVI